MSPRDLNDRGEAAGISVFPDGFQATRWNVDGTVRTLGAAYYIPGASINDRGEEAWVQVLGQFSNPTGFDIRLWQENRAQSLGILPFDPDEPSDRFAPFRLTDKGIVLWGYGRWVYGRDRVWRQYMFPIDVISNPSVVDVNKFGIVIGSGFRLSLGMYGGFTWTQADVPVAVPPPFLPQRILDDGTMVGYHLGAPGAQSEVQVPTIRRPDGTLEPLPIPAPPSGYALYYGWIFDVTEEGQAVGALTYIELNSENPNVVGGPILWTLARGSPLEASTAQFRAVALPTITDAYRLALCRHPAASMSPFCRSVAATTELGPVPGP